MKLTILYDSKIAQMSFEGNNLEELRHKIALHTGLNAKQFVIFEYEVGETSEKKVESISQLRDGMSLIIAQNDYMFAQSEQFVKVSNYFGKSNLESSFEVIDLGESQMTKPEKPKLPQNEADSMKSFEEGKPPKSPSQPSQPTGDENVIQKEQLLLSEIALNIQKRENEQNEKDDETEDKEDKEIEILILGLDDLSSGDASSQRTQANDFDDKSFGFPSAEDDAQPFDIEDALKDEINEDASPVGEVSEKSFVSSSSSEEYASTDSEFEMDKIDGGEENGDKKNIEEMGDRDLNQKLESEKTDENEGHKQREEDLNDDQNDGEGLDPGEGEFEDLGNKNEEPEKKKTDSKLDTGIEGPNEKKAPETENTEKCEQDDPGAKPKGTNKRTVPGKNQQKSKKKKPKFFNIWKDKSVAEFRNLMKKELQYMSKRMYKSVFQELYKEVGQFRQIKLNNVPMKKLQESLKHVKYILSKKLRKKKNELKNILRNFNKIFKYNFKKVVNKLRFKFEESGRNSKHWFEKRLKIFKIKMTRVETKKTNRYRKKFKELKHNFKKIKKIIKLIIKREKRKNKSIKQRAPKTQFQSSLIQSLKNIQSDCFVFSLKKVKEDPKFYKYFTEEVKRMESKVQIDKDQFKKRRKLIFKFNKNKLRLDKNKVKFLIFGTSYRNFSKFQQFVEQNKLSFYS